MGLVNKVSKSKEWLTDALELAAVVARRPPIAARLAKQAVLAADETTLGAGLAHERRLFELAMATEDRRRGHAGVPREAQAGVPRPVSAEVPSTLGVVGAGTMGAGIAQLGCAAGMRVRAARPAARGARGRARAGPPRARALGREGQARRRTRPGRSSRPARWRASARCDLVIEAAPERPRPEARAVRPAVGGLLRRRGARHEHLVDHGDRARGRGGAARERRRDALLQPAAADEAARGDPRRPDRRARAGRGAAPPARRWARP